MSIASTEDLAVLNREFEQIVSEIQPFYHKLTDEQCIIALSVPLPCIYVFVLFVVKTRITLWIRKFHEKQNDLTSMYVKFYSQSFLIDFFTGGLETFIVHCCYR